MARDPAVAGNGCTKKHAAVIGLCVTIFLAIIVLLGGWLWADVNSQGKDLKAAEKEVAVLKSEMGGLRTDVTEIKGDVKQLIRSQPGRGE